MRATRILILSVGLNLLLVALLAMQKFTHAIEPSPKTPVKIVRQTNVVVQTNLAAKSPTQTNSVIPFHWRELESEDYHQYMANLRGVGCPERVVQNVILQDVDQAFSSRPRPMKPLWITGSKRRAWEKSENEFEAKLGVEKADLVRTLLGFEADSKTRWMWADETEGFFLLGFLTDHQAEQVLAIAHRHINQFMWLFDSDIPTPQDIAHARSVYEAMIARFQEVASPPEVEEGLLRTYSAITSLDRFQGDEKPTAANRRAFARLFMREIGVMDWFLLHSLPFQKTPTFSAEFITEAPKLIGTMPFIEMMGNETIGSFVETLKEVGRPASDVLPVYLVQKAAYDEAESIRSTPGLSHREKRVKLQALQKEVMQAVINVVGESAEKVLTSSTKNWWAELGSP